MTAEANQPILETRDLVVAYHGRVVLNGVDLAVQPRETLAVLAAGGAGKTALFRILLDLDPPTAGKVFWFGRDVSKLRHSEKQRLRRDIGAVHHNGALFADLTVTENIKLPLIELADLDKDQIESTVRLMLTVTGLFPFRHFHPGALSSVMVQQAALARALALGPKLLICDDIFAGLDRRAQHQIDRTLRALHILRDRATIILTHNIPVAFQLADRIAVLSEGRIVAIDSPQAIRDSEHPAVRALLGNAVEDAGFEPGDWVRQVMGRQ